MIVNNNAIKQFPFSTRNGMQKQSEKNQKQLNILPQQ
jgi:hypothetical protein